LREQRQRAKDTNNRGPAYRAVHDFLDKHLPEWRDPLHALAMEKAASLVEWIKEHNDRLPQYDGDVVERRQYKLLEGWRAARRGVGNKQAFIVPVRKYLDA